MATKESVTITQEQLHEKINGVIITIGADIREYGHKLNITGDEEIFGCDLLTDWRCPRGSFIIPLESVVKLRDYLTCAISVYYPQEMQRELTPREKALEMMNDLITRIYKV